jgi:hypothetical protein
VVDENDNEHYFLTVTERMTSHQLRVKLCAVADRMSVIREAQDTL